MDARPAPAPDDEIDLRQLGAALVRRWPWIAGGGALGLLAAAGVTAISKPVWEGEFQIVLAKKETAGGGGLASLAGGNPMLAQLAGLGGGGGGGELETEVKILESPLVLRPVFDLVKASKVSQGEPVEELRFADWVKDNLEVKLEKGTTVLNISYQDNDRALVLPVLQRISQAYQAYSGRDRSESLRNGLAYAREQVVRFRQQADASNRARDSYAVRYGISSQGGSIASTGVDVSKLLNSAASGGSGPAVSVGGGGSSIGPSLNAQGDPLGQLAAVNQELIRRQQQFTNRDPGIQALQRERDALRRYIETTAGGNLALPGQKPLSKEQAQEIMVRYQELERNAKRDTAILDSLENTLLSLQLEQARATKPWELISTPSVLDKPVSPRPLRNLALGLLAGLVLGSGGALVADRRSGRVFATDELRQLLPYPLLASLESLDEWPATLTLLAQGPLAGAVQVALVPAGDVPDAQAVAQALQTALQAADPAAQVLLTRDLAAAARCNAQLLLAAPGAASRHALAQLQQNLQLQGRPVAGLLVLSDAA
jgi:succinoglycan biosynthesis transport protein ExoP